MTDVSRRTMLQGEGTAVLVAALPARPTAAAPPGAGAVFVVGQTDRARAVAACSEAAVFRAVEGRDVFVKANFNSDDPRSARRGLADINHLGLLVPWLVLILVVTGCATARVTPPPAPPRAGSPTPPRPPAPGVEGFEQTGEASWYGDQHHGKLTTSGEPFDMNKLTAAHRTLPLGTRVRVTNVGNGRSVEVRINDRGPYVAGRIIDLSYAAAQRLGAVGAGVIRVTLKVVVGPGGDAPIVAPSD